MPRLAATVPSAMAQLAQRPGGPTRALDAAERGAVLGDITNSAMGGDKRSQNKGVTGPRASKPPIEALRSALILYVTEQHTVGKPISLKDAGAKFGVGANNVTRMARKLSKDSLADALAQIEAIDWPRAGNPEIVAREYLTKDEKDVLAEMIKLRADMGFPLDVDMVAATCSEILGVLDKGEDSWTGKPVACGRRFVEKFLAEYGLGKYKSSSIDPKRVAQATAEVRDAWFDLIERIVDRAFKSGQTTWPTPADIPLECIHNMDETAHDPTQGRGTIVARKESRKRKASESSDVAAARPKYLRRSFEKTDADRAKFHVTDVMWASGKGELMPSMIIQSCPGVDDPHMRKSLMENIVWQATTDEERASRFCRDGRFNAENIDVRVSTNGSMTRALFPKWCEHFVRNLPPGQGKGGLPVFLFFDGHASRWSYLGLNYLEMNNVIAICVPSHSTIWSQPNDAGLNSAFKTHFAKCCRTWRGGDQGELGCKAHLHNVMDRGDFNGIFVRAQRSFREEQQLLLQTTGKNAIRSGFVNTGIAPFNRNCSYWREIIDTLGKSNLGPAAPAYDGTGAGCAQRRLPTPAEEVFDVAAADLSLLDDNELATLACTRCADEETGAAAVRLVKGALRRWQESPGSSREPSPINEQEAAAFKCAPATRRGGAGDSEHATLLVTLTRCKLESALKGATFRITDAAPEIGEGGNPSLTTADARAVGACATIVRKDTPAFMVIYDDSATYSLKELPLSDVLAGVGTRFVLVEAAELLRIGELEQTMKARRHAKRVENQKSDALSNDRRRIAEARCLGRQRVLAASMGLSDSQLEVLTIALTKPPPETVDGHIVSLVPTSRAIVVRDTVYDVMRRPLEESGRNLARPQRRGVNGLGRGAARPTRGSAGTSSPSRRSF